MEAAQFEVIAITLGSERVVDILTDMDAAFNACITRWHSRKVGGPIYAVRDCQTEQRWSYRDILDLRAQVAA